MDNAQIPDPTHYVRIFKDCTPQDIWESYLLGLHIPRYQWDAVTSIKVYYNYYEAEFKDWGHRAPGEEHDEQP